jgi:6-pyruvoyltetrahydropterin/6-carboxytetrahydropterin synthase
VDSIGRIVDFAVIKSKLCNWLEENWDHKFLMYEKDTLLPELSKLVPGDIVACSFNPTAENMAMYLCEEVGVRQLEGTGCTLVKCMIEETRKCSATYEIKIPN